MRRQLTEFVIKNAKCSGNGYTIWDQQMKGLGLRVLKFRKTWTVMHGRARTRVTLGHYPEMGLAEARDAAYEARHRKEMGIRLPRAIDEFLDDCRAHNRPQTVQTREWVLGKVVQPALGDRFLSAVTHRQVMEIVGQQTQSVGIVTFAVVRALFSYCVNQGYLATSPLAGKKPPRASESRERVLSDAELKAVVSEALRGAWTHEFSRLVALLAFTGQRRGQFGRYTIGEDQSVWTDFASKTITFPAEVMKGKKVHVIPYPSCIESLLYYPLDLKGFSRHKAAFDERCGVTDWTLHDLRRTFSTNCARLRLHRENTERIMDHVQGGVRSVYDRHAYLEEMREVIEAHASFLSNLCGSGI